MFMPCAFLKWRESVTSLYVLCPCPAVCVALSGHQQSVCAGCCFTASETWGYFPSLPAQCVKNRQYSSMVWHLCSAAQGHCFSGCCCSWKMVFAALGWSFLSFEQNLPYERKRCSAFLVRRAQDLPKSHAFLPLCAKLAGQPSLFCLCWSVHLLPGKIAIRYV